MLRAAQKRPDAATSDLTQATCPNEVVAGQGRPSFTKDN